MTLSDIQCKIRLKTNRHNNVVVGQEEKVRKELRKTSVKLEQEQFDIIENIAKKEGTTISEVMRDLIDKGLSERVLEDNTNLIAGVVRQQLEVVMKPHIERLAALSSKTGHMASTATFLNVQSLMDLVPPERRKDVVVMYESARKKAVAYMKIRTDDFDERDIFK